MDTIIIAIIVVLAIGYLYRHFSSAFKNKDPSYGCGGCGACKAQFDGRCRLNRK